MVGFELLISRFNLAKLCSNRPSPMCIVVYMSEKSNFHAYIWSYQRWLQSLYLWGLICVNVQLTFVIPETLISFLLHFDKCGQVKMACWMLIFTIRNDANTSILLSLYPLQPLLTQCAHLFYWWVIVGWKSQENLGLPQTDIPDRSVIDLLSPTHSSTFLNCVICLKRSRTKFALCM